MPTFIYFACRHFFPFYHTFIPFISSPPQALFYYLPCIAVFIYPTPYYVHYCAYLYLLFDILPTWCICCSPFWNFPFSLCLVFLILVIVPDSSAYSSLFLLCTHLPSVRYVIGDRDGLYMCYHTFLYPQLPSTQP